MKNDNMSVYLNDHLAGSIAAIDLVDHLIKATAGTALEKFFKDMSAEIQTDQDTLEQLMSHLDIAQSGFRKTSAWLAEKMAMIKLGPDLTKEGNFGIYQAFEGLALGIAGKKKLWQALAQVIGPDSHAGKFDFFHLEKRADEQHENVEKKRMAMAAEALGGDGGQD
ncbi:MAG: hypothetical protein WCD79_08950 [Chthoniobacteraceae bacterium]